jgi:23S rRNA (guanine745-N1)-methyltransferase
MLEAAVAALRCPVCRGGLRDAGHGLVCDAGHAFDVARQGYVALFAGGGRPATGDSALMVAARERFLAAGHYALLRAAVARAASSGPSAHGTPRVIVEVGAGTAYHLAGALDACPGAIGIALDASAPAARRAARAHSRAVAVRADAWAELPVASGRVDALLSVFAPRNAQEAARILRPEGRWVVATPEPDHLRELVQTLDLLTVDAAKPDRLRRQVGSLFAAEAATEVRSEMLLAPPDVAALVAMGPSAHHVDGARLAPALATLEPVMPVTLAATVRTYTPR